MPPHALTLPHAFLMAMQEHVLACLPDEACGLIGGRASIGLLWLPVTNRLASPGAYEMDARATLAVFQRFEAENMDLLAIFHSHPTGPAVPSPTDIHRFAYPGVWSLILSPRGQGWQLRAFRIAGGGFSEGQLNWQP